MIPKVIQRGMGDWLGATEEVCWNRTGATVLRGQVAMVDLLDTQAEVTNIIEGNELSVWATLGPVVQASVEEGFPCVVALEDIADNAKGRWKFWGKVEVAVLDDDVSTTDIDKGDRVSILVAEASAAGGALTTGGAHVQAFVTGAVNRVVGIALEDAAATSADTDRLINASSHLRWVLWTGGIPVLGSSDT